ncbi:MAG: hypothetical protein EU531_07270 [Promethearchaeota archaeon]|nr:MAG: hypothetical protein EU531_07270 [Candidatus Lokiarchaeota archaeon]
MKSPHEDVFIYLDLTKEILKKKDIIKAIKYYISEKNKINLNGHYGLLIFQEEGNPIFLTGKKDSTIILNAIDENWKLRPKKKSFFENGLFYIFSYIAETVRKKSKIYRVIVITDTPSDLSEDYTDALFSLVSKIKVFPTFIDIIRISERDKRFFKDDVKLNILASDTKGGIFYIQDKTAFKQVIKKLVQSKQIVDLVKDQSEKIKITRSDYDFYSQLAKELKISSDEYHTKKCYFCSELICPVCASIDDKLKICPECSSAFHNCCLINYVIQNNIGIPHIFRCPNCDVLLKINQDELVRPQDNLINSAEEYLKLNEDLGESFESDIHFKPIPKIKELNMKGNLSKEKSLLIPSTKESTNLKEKPQVVWIGGYFGKLYTVQKMGDKLIYQKVKPYQDTPEENKVNKLPPVTKKKSLLSSEGNTLKYSACPECGTDFTSDFKKGEICPFCGHKLE